MRRNLFIYIAALVLGAGGGFFAPKFGADKAAQRELATASTATNLDFDLGSWAAIPCVSRAEWERYKSEFKITKIDENAHWDPATNAVTASREQAPRNLASDIDPLCNDSYLVTRLSKTLFLAENYSISVPSNWPIDFKNALGNLYLYLKQATDSLGYDPTQASAAYNSVSNIKKRGEIRIGSALLDARLDYTPIDFLSTLAHESRHSSSNDKSDLKTCYHVRCHNSSFHTVGVDSICDEWLRMDNYSGAYSMSVIYGLAAGQGAKNISPAELSHITDNALSWLSTSFNNLPGNLAAPIETLVALDQSGQVQIIHPFTYATKPINVYNLTPARLEGSDSRCSYVFSADNQADCLFPVKSESIYYTSSPFGENQDTAWLAFTKGHSYSTYKWSGYGQPLSAQADLPGGPARRQPPILKVGTQTNNDTNENSGACNSCNAPQQREPNAVLINRIYRESFLSSDFQIASEKPGYVFPAKLPAGLKARRLLGGPAQSALVLDEQGGAFISFPGSSQFIWSKFQNPEGSGWANMSSSVFHDVLFANSSSGRVYVSQYDKTSNDLVSVPFENFFPSPGIGAKRVREGVNQIGYVGTNGTIYVSGYNNFSWTPLPVSAGKNKTVFVDLVWSKRNLLIGEPGDYFNKAPDPNWSQRCGVTLAIREPWTGQQVGLDRDNQLVFEDSNNACTRINLAARVPALGAHSIVKIQIGTGEKSEKIFLPPRLELILNDGSLVAIPPYSL